LKQQLEQWNPHQNPHVNGDPFKTLFVARLSYTMDESMLRHAFSRYGSIRNISLVKDTVTGKFKGYAFIEFDHEKDMRAAFKDTDGLKLDGRRILVDFERGRTVKNWHPRRLGGGLGGTRLGGEKENIKVSGRVPFGNLDEKTLYEQERDSDLRRSTTSSTPHYDREKRGRDSREYHRDRRSDDNYDHHHRDHHKYRERQRHEYRESEDRDLKRPRVSSSAPIEEGEIA
jgi:U1 small nuclear ribonucleoprotein